MTLTAAPWDVLYPHRNTPWAAVRREAGGAVHGVYDPDSGASFRIEPGRDPALPGLAFWLPNARLVSYRPRRRATLTGEKGGRPVFIKVVRPSRAAALASLYRSMRPLIVAAELRVPELLSVDLELGALIFSKLNGESLHESWPRQAVNFGLIGRKLGSLGSMTGPESLPLRSHSDLGWWIDQVASRDPEPSADFATRLHVVAQDLPRYMVKDEGVVHGDLHDGNLLIDEDEVGLLDLDMAGRGDPVRDLAMLTAHLELNALQNRKVPPATEVADLWAGYRRSTPLEDDQARAATAIELTRLACLYRFRSKWRRLTPDLLDRAAAWSREAESGARPAPVRKRRLTPRAALQSALEPGRVTHELQERWDQFEWVGSTIVAAEVTRVHEREDEYTLELDLAVAEQPHRLRLLAEIVDGDVDDRLDTSLQQLRRRSRGQLRIDEDGLASVPALQLLVRRPGLDRRLPVLDLLHRPKRAAHALADYLGGKGVEVELLGHRLDKRATMRARRGPASVIVKGYKARSDLPEKVVSWSSTIRQHSRPGLAVPAPLGLLESRQAVVWEDLGNAARSEWGPIGTPEEIAAVGRALSWLHDIDALDLPMHGVAAELDVLDRSQRLLEAGAPQLAAAILPTLVHISAGLVAFDPGAAATVHRDAHPGQFLVREDHVSIVDLDSLSVGEPAIDLGNYAAYLRIANESDGEARLHDGYQSQPDVIDRTATWRDAALYRLGVQLALTTDRAELGHRILKELSRP